LQLRHRLLQCQLLRCVSTGDRVDLVQRLLLGRNCVLKAALQTRRFLIMRSPADAQRPQLLLEFLALDIKQASAPPSQLHTERQIQTQDLHVVAVVAAIQALPLGTSRNVIHRLPAVVSLFARPATWERRCHTYMQLVDSISSGTGSF